MKCPVWEPAQGRDVPRVAETLCLEKIRVKLLVYRDAQDSRRFCLLQDSLRSIATVVP